ncbi:FAD-dependent oxidoreductase [Streptosporangium sp. NPDC020072]|uniref:FAD-dependent oxidoreductase n=1 Tax=Streptosporangium sp. NPDC020072 TaxID=3154788 RepID=UPI00343FC3B1
MSSATRHAQVIGAGLGGLTAAAALAQRGWTVRLHERDPEIRAIGAGIYLWGNGLSVLRALGVFDEAVEGAHLGPVAESRDRHGHVVESIPINGEHGPELYTILRRRLIDALAGAAVRAGVEIVTGSTAVAATPDGEVEFADGTRRRSDLVVAADGVNSRLRDSLGLLRRRVRMPQGAARMLVPRRPGFVAPADEAKYIEYFSGSRRILYTPSSADRLYVALVCSTGDEHARRVPLDKDTWLRSFPLLEELIGCLDTESRWDRFEFLELRRWSAGVVSVLGDAAHAQPPYLGQGGGCAMMNALGLAEAVTFGEGDLETRLRRWEAAERPVIQHTQRFSYRLGHLNPLPDRPRAALLAVMNRSRSLARMRMRAATTIPTGMNRFPA